jgi:hypothetical protein
MKKINNKNKKIIKHEIWLDEPVEQEDMVVAEPDIVWIHLGIPHSFMYELFREIEYNLNDRFPVEISLEMRGEKREEVLVIKPIKK